MKAKFVDTAIPRWIKITKTFADFAVADITNTVEIYSLPDGGIIHYAYIKSVVAFVGPGLGAYNLMIGDGYAGPTTILSSGYDLQTVGDGNYYSSGAALSGYLFPKELNPSFLLSDAPSSIVAKIDADINLNLATAGVVNIWLLVSILPH
jgi:hypothetical protein